MKILYGVQATGNGHITRARAINAHLAQNGIETDFLFSGRERELFFDMEAFGDWRCCQGLTFQHEAGKIKLLKTAQKNSVRQLWKDIRTLDLSSYDLVLTDFEPISAWAAKRQGKLCVGVGHQYAFHHEVPSRGHTLAGSLVMKHFAPADVELGLHWHHFNAPILPPIAETHSTDAPVDPNKILVYLGFEEPEHVINLLEQFEDQLFVFYGPFAQYESRGHIQLKPLSREGFKKDLATAGGVICNAGFELSSEAIQLGKKLLVKPLLGQMEQLSNAEALKVLGLGSSMDTLDPAAIREWLNQPAAKPVRYPEVAKGIVEWLAAGDWRNEEKRLQLIRSMWENTDANGVACFDNAPLPPLQPA
ncbi:MJ1255/VC2487 family glycosyltransferase [Agaribacterium haliotis]|uniref:MJ1255/VC2487 family glycosyltransferase n=1 Tax=Agaribacterium haliotis TaxID=2013869 RepID=UPI000BB5851D|nr:MJ1255/VC2487 family glycosyltransferase [Agaribacterium haliotis]